MQTSRVCILTGNVHLFNVHLCKTYPSENLSGDKLFIIYTFAFTFFCFLLTLFDLGSTCAFEK